MILQTATLPWRLAVRSAIPARLVSKLPTLGRLDREGSDPNWHGEKLELLICAYIYLLFKA